MPGTLRTCLFGSLFVLAVPMLAAAQKLQAGTWTGTIKPPNEAPVTVTFDVTIAGDSTRITAKGTPVGDLPFHDVRVTADRMIFTLEVGETIRCTLLLGASKAWKGNCLDADGGTGVIEMIPPKN